MPNFPFRTRLPFLALGLALLGSASPALAQDAATGEKAFARCRSCHAITAPDGTSIVKGGKMGPNLYGVVGRPAASADGYKYSDALKELGAAGEIWTEEDIAAYITDPSAYIRDKTGDAKARSKMVFKLTRNQADIAAYLASVAK